MIEKPSVDATTASYNGHSDGITRTSTPVFSKAFIRSPTGSTLCGSTVSRHTQ